MPNIAPILKLTFLLLAIAFQINPLAGQLTNLLKDPSARGTHPEEPNLFGYSKRHLDSLKEYDLLYEDSTLVAYLYEITDRLLPGVREDVPWEIYVTTSLAPNASAFPDGRIYIDAGMLARLDHEAQIAFVLAHELAHYLYRHSAQEWDFINELKGSKIFAKKKAERRGLFSQQQELEADEIAVHFYALAGYPKAQLDEAMRRWPPEINFGGFLRLLLGQSDKMRSHPRTPDRIARLNEIASKTTFSGDYEGRDYMSITAGIRLAARKALAKVSTNGSFPYQIRMIDSLLANLPEDELDDPFVWDMRLKQADCRLKLLSLSHSEANRQIIMDQRRAAYRGESIKDEVNASIMLATERKKNTSPELLADVRAKFVSSLDKLKAYPVHAPETDRLLGMLHYEEENYTEALPLLENYLADDNNITNRRLIRKMVRESKSALTDPKSRKKKKRN